MPPVQMRGVQRPKNTLKTILRLIRYTGKFKALWPVLFLCVIVSSMAGVAGTYLLKPALNEYIIPFIGNQSPPVAEFAKFVLMLLGIYILGVIGSFCTQRILLFISTQTLCNIREDLFSHMETLPLKYYDSHPHGVLMSLYTNDTDTIRDMFSQSVPQLMTGAFQVTGVFCMMLVLSIPLTLVMIVTIFFMMMIAAKVGKLSARAYREQQENIGNVNGYIEEMIEGLRVVKVFTMEEETNGKFRVMNDKLCEAGTRANTYSSILGPIMNNLSHLQYAIVAMTGGLLIIFGFMDIGTIASFLHSTRAFSQPLSQISQQFNSILNALAGAERIFAVIDEESETDSGTVKLVNAVETLPSASNDGESHLVESFSYTGQWAWKVPATGQLKRMRGEIVLDNVSFGYEKNVRVLNRIKIHAKPGQKIALVGSTGSGKTTITNLITRFYDLEEHSGSITYDGIPIKDIEKSHLRRSLGMVLQDIHLFTGTVKENIRYGNLEASDYQIYEAAKLANADSFIKNLSDGYDTVIKGDGGNLSQGQRQLIAIARAAVANPAALILDEATSSIDTRTESLVEKGMDSLMKGRTVFVIAHRLSTVRNSDCIIVLEKGSIVEHGNHDELMAKKGRYYQLYTGAFNLE